jgi:hypothetical protein
MTCHMLGLIGDHAFQRAESLGWAYFHQLVQLEALAMSAFLLGVGGASSSATRIAGFISGTTCIPALGGALVVATSASTFLTHGFACGLLAPDPPASPTCASTTVQIVGSSSQYGHEPVPERFGHGLVVEALGFCIQ